MGSHSITDFINGFGGGHRINRFKVTGSIPTLNTNTITAANPVNTSKMVDFTDFHVRAASLPTSQLGVIPVNFRGRTVNYPGDRIYQPWNIVVIDDNKQASSSEKSISLYRAFHEWHERINSHVNNLSTYESSGNTDPSQHFAGRIKADGTVLSINNPAWTIEQLDTNGAKTIRKFELWNCWPVAVGPVELDMSQDNVLSTFAVTVVFSHLKFDLSTSTTTGTFI
jgi:hypothetical protein